MTAVPIKFHFSNFSTAQRKISSWQLNETKSLLLLLLLLLLFWTLEFDLRFRLELKFVQTKINNTFKGKSLESC